MSKSESLANQPTITSFFYDHRNFYMEVYLSTDLEEVVNQSLHCGNGRSFERKVKIGMNAKQVHELEATVGGSLGTEGLAGLKAEIKEKTGTEVSFSREEEVTDRFDFNCPPCGIKNCLMCQKVVKMKLYITRKKNGLLSLFRPNDVTTRRIIEEKTKQFVDLSTQKLFIKECNCSKPDLVPAPINGKGKHLMVELGKLSKLVEVYENEHGIEIPEFGISVPSKKIADLIDGFIQVPTPLLPDDFLFNSGVNLYHPNIALLLRDLTEVEHRYLAGRDSADAPKPEEQPLQENSTGVDLLPLLVGITCGLTVSLLLRPSQGEASRKFIKQKAEKLSKKANDLSGQLSAQINDTISKISKSKNPSSPANKSEKTPMISNRGKK